MEQQHLHQIALYNEKIVGKQFKKLGYRVERLDKQGPRKRPEFLVLTGTGPELICEVKTIFSAGFLPNRNAHVSTEDPRLLNGGPFHIEIDLSKIDKCLHESVVKYRELTADYPQYNNTPLVVAFFFDFFANFFDFYPRRMESFPDVSGILKIEKDREIYKMAEKMSLMELEESIKNKSMHGFPPSSKKFVLVKNECARIKLPRTFIDACIVQ